MERMKSFEAASADIYRYLNFDQMPDYTEIADTVSVELA
jgi:aconitate hydratase 2/2-methylisocitrate dehydratase